MRGLRQAVIERPATTFADVLAKATAFTWGIVDETDPDLSGTLVERAALLAEDIDGRPLTEALAIIDDLTALAEAHGITRTNLAPPAGAKAADALIAQVAA